MRGHWRGKQAAAADFHHDPVHNGIAASDLEDSRITDGLPTATTPVNPPPALRLILNHTPYRRLQRAGVPTLLRRSQLV